MSTVCAEEPAAAKHSLALESAECGVYYAVVREGMGRTMSAGDEKRQTLVEFDQMSKSAFEFSRKLVGDELSLAYIKMGTQKIAEMMHRDYEYIAIVAAEYAFPCKSPIRVRPRPPRSGPPSFRSHGRPAPWQQDIVDA